MHIFLAIKAPKIKVFQDILIIIGTQMRQLGLSLTQLQLAHTHVHT